MKRKKKKTFYTLMLNLENIHLVKDVGMIPYVMHKELGYNSYVVSYKELKDLPYLETDLKGLKCVSCKRYTGNIILDGIIWLLKNSSKIDILNLYHYKYSTFFWILCYKLCNPLGKVYLKLDIDPDAGMNMKMKKHTIKMLVTKWILGMCHVVSCETKCFQKYANQHWPIHLEHISNGVLKKEICFQQKKEKIIMTVGRLGTRQKATEILLKAFQDVYKDISPEWKLYLVGEATEKVKKYIDSICRKDLELSHRIVLTGAIYNRNQLLELYSKCTIFTMPSRFEGFSIATVEALAKGDYLLLSELPSFKEITTRANLGQTFKIDDVKDYAEKLKILCSAFDANIGTHNIAELESEIKKKYSWEAICRQLEVLLMKR